MTTPTAVDRVVGISEFAVSSDPGATLVTYALGSCVALVLHDPAAGVGGLLHAMMPTSHADPDRAARQPAMYVDTGAVALLQAAFDLGATRSGLVAKVVGAATKIAGVEALRIGERNYMVMRRVLWKNEILIAAEDVGGAGSRTVSLEIGTGRTLVKSGGVITTL